MDAVIPLKDIFQTTPFLFQTKKLTMPTQLCHIIKATTFTNDDITLDHKIANPAIPEPEDCRITTSRKETQQFPVAPTKFNCESNRD